MKPRTNLAIAFLSIALALVAFVVAQTESEPKRVPPEFASRNDENLRVYGYKMLHAGAVVVRAFGGKR